MTTLKWLKLKKGGAPPTARTGQPWIAIERKKGAVMFGGVFDREETDEDLISQFCNDMFLFQYESKKFFIFKLRRKKKTTTEKKIEQLQKEGQPADDDLEDEEEYDPGCPTGVAKIEKYEEVDPFALKKEEDAMFNTPSERSHCLLAAKGTHALAGLPFILADDSIVGTTLYLYGGMREEGEKEITMNDLYSLDTNRLDKWVRLQASDTVQWVGEESDDDEEEGDEGDEDDDEDDDSDSDDDDDEEEEEPKGKGKKPVGKGEKPAAKGVRPRSCARG